MSVQSRYHLGLPAWAYPGWLGPYFPPGRPALESYARVFNTVEGNTTFYAIPDEKTVAAWARAVAGTDFNFCFKLPRTVTHERKRGSSELKQFFGRLEPLREHLGPFMIQLPPTVGPDQLPELERLVERLPRRNRYVIEVRHQAFFEDPGLLEPLIAEFGLGRVMLDSRPIYEGDRSHPEVLDALHEKPDVPVLGDVCNGIAFVRLILHPDLASNESYLDEWATRCRDYLGEANDVFMMIHCPNNQHCPALAEDFHRRLHGLCDERLAVFPPYPVPQQVSLL